MQQHVLLLNDAGRSLNWPSKLEGGPFSTSGNPVTLSPYLA